MQISPRLAQSLSLACALLRCCRGWAGPSQPATAAAEPAPTRPASADGHQTTLPNITRNPMKDIIFPGPGNDLVLAGGIRPSTAVLLLNAGGRWHRFASSVRQPGVASSTTSWWRRPAFQPRMGTG